IYLLGELQPRAAQEEVIVVLVWLQGDGLPVAVYTVGPCFVAVGAEAVLVQSIGSDSRRVDAWYAAQSEVEDPHAQGERGVHHQPYRAAVWPLLALDPLRAEVSAPC